MCGRYAQFRSIEAVRAFFGASGPPPNHPPSWNIAPTQTAPVIRRHPETGERHLGLLRWGLMPRWVKEPRSARQPLNARAETVSTNPMFRTAFAERRCLVPADAFYEWRVEPGGKQPFAIARRDGEMLAFAGLWEHWRSTDGEIVRTFAIVTTSANAPMRALHDRMPVILEPEDWTAWLEGPDPGGLLRPAPENVLRLWPISRAVNSPRNNGPELLEEHTLSLAPGGGPNPA